MTRKFNEKETQTGFLGWVRNNPALESLSKSLAIQDTDFWVHKFKTVGTKDYQFLMHVELKEFGADLSSSQRDTLHIINQLLRNRRNTREEWNAIDEGPRISGCFSLLNKKRIEVRCYGSHLLQIGGDGTFTQWQRICWNRKPITSDQLEKVLLFELDPDTLSKLDHRPDKRHKRVTTVKEEKTELGFTVDRYHVSRS
jgi:hypothetical protein